MGVVGNVSRDLYGAPGRSNVHPARFPKENAADKPKRSRVSTRKTPVTHTRTEKKTSLRITEFDSVWTALEISSQEAVNLEIRSELMLQMRKLIKDAGWSQAVAAKRCGVSQPRMNDLLRGKINKFSIDALVMMLGGLGQQLVFRLEAA